MRKIIHLDCDCFYAAVEMRDNPEYREVPLAIGGSSDRRGVISTCNYQAREFGVHSAMATARAIKLCPDLKVIPGNMYKYREVSAQIMAIYRDYASLIEPLSLDEAFLDVTDSDLCHGSATLIAEEIRNRVRAETGIVVSAGVAPNKFLAKIASDWNKPDGLCVVSPERVADFVRELPVKKIFGVGKKTAERMHRLGIHTCADLRAMTMAQLVDHFGRFGRQLHDLSRGVDDRPVRVSRERKSISVEHTYPKDIATPELCLEQIPRLMDDLNRRFERISRRQQIKGAVVKVKFCDFTQMTAERATDEVSPEHFRQLMQSTCERGNKPVRLLGLGYRLEPREEGQGTQLALL